MHRILSILCYVVAGFFVYAAGLMSFVGKVPLTPKLSLCCGAVAIGALFLGIGLAFVRYKYWRRDIGVVCLAGVAVAVSVVLCFYWTVWVAPEALRDAMPQRTIAVLSAWGFGVSFNIIVGGLGLTMLLKPAGSLDETLGDPASQKNP